MSKILKGKYFTLYELIQSNVAEEKGINNTPQEKDIIDNIEYTISRLDEIREGYGKPIYINSGYRCPQLNKAVGGVEDSYHLKGLAVDIRWDNELVEYIINNCQFHKAIREKAGKSKWLHLQFKRDRSKEKNKVISISK